MQRGLYESLITEILQKQLDDLDDSHSLTTEKLKPAESVAEGDDTITLTLGMPDNDVIGDTGVHTVTLREANVAPVVSLSIQQAGFSVTQINRTAGLVTIDARVTDANESDSHTLEWTSSNNDLINQAVRTASSLTFDPASMAAGVFSVSVTATDSGDGQLSTEAHSAILVIESDESVSTLIDSDGDRIPDSDDTISELWLLPSGVSTALIQTVPGQRLVLGETVFADTRYRALLLPGDLDTLQGDDAFSQKETSGIGYLYPAGLFDVEIHGIASGGVAHLVIPVDGGIPDGARVRRRDPATGQWQDVELTDSDRVLSFGNSNDNDNDNDNELSDRREFTVILDSITVRRRSNGEVLPVEISHISSGLLTIGQDAKQ